MFNNSANTTIIPHKDYLYYEKKSGSKCIRRCIDGRITGSGNCVGYCQYSRHSGFLTKKHIKEHNCIEKGCFYFLPKIKRKRPKNEVDNRPHEIVKIASDLISEFEGIRILKAERNQNRGWTIKYISITNGYSIKSIENKITAAVGEKITMVNLNYDFDRAAQLIFA